MCFGYATIWTSYHPDSRLKPLVWASAALVPAVTGYMRVRAGEHFLSDVLAGYGTGHFAAGWWLSGTEKQNGTSPTPLHQRNHPILILFQLTLVEHIRQYPRYGFLPFHGK
jgi:membrane-associated phospholipid phosphatase